MRRESTDGGGGGSGRHVPSVRTALALSWALDISVDCLFGDDSPPPEPVIGDVLPRDGSAVVVGRVGERLVVAAVDHRVAEAERWAMTDATVADGTVALLDGASIDGLVIAGCDPALGLVAGLVERVTPFRVVTVQASTGDRSTGFAAGRVHGVVLWDGRPASGPIAGGSAAVATRTLAGRCRVGPCFGVPSFDEIAERGLRVVQRDPGAATQEAFERALGRIGVESPVPGAVVGGHVDVARRVAEGADAGVTMEAAARSFGLGFDAIEEHTVEVWLDARWAEMPAAVALVDMLNSTSLRSEARAHRRVRPQGLRYGTPCGLNDAASRWPQWRS